MDVVSELKLVLDEVLSLHGRAQSFTADTPLLGALPELDSMAVVAVLSQIEEHFGITIGDDDVDGDTFVSFGSLLRFVESQIN